MSACSSKPENPDTGIEYGLFIVPIGAAAIYTILKISKKNSKIFKI